MTENIIILLFENFISFSECLKSSCSIRNNAIVPSANAYPTVPSIVINVTGIIGLTVDDATVSTPNITPAVNVDEPSTIKLSSTGSDAPPTWTPPRNVA